MNSSKSRQVFNQICAEENLELDPEYFDVLFDTCTWLNEQLQTGRKTLGISGAQGSGKSTFASLIAKLLTAEERQVEVLSLDDFYLTKSERRDLSLISPLLEVRGVPGTHDLARCVKTVKDFQSGASTTVPIFKKSEDDRIGERDVNFAHTQLLIFEGWCWGAKPQAEEDLAKPVNDLERRKDTGGVWRRYVNERLVDYQELFAVDFSIGLRVPSFDAVKRWRWQQEQGLNPGSASMSEAEVFDFVQYFQRLTESLLATNFAGFDRVISIDTHHKFHLK